MYYANNTYVLQQQQQQQQQCYETHMINCMCSTHAHKHTHVNGKQKENEITTHKHVCVHVYTYTLGILSTACNPCTISVLGMPFVNNLSAYDDEGVGVCAHARAHTPH